MSASVEIVGLSALLARIRRAPREMEKSGSALLAKESRTWITHMRSRGSGLGRMQARAASTMEARQVRGGVEIRGGGGSIPEAFMGSEFGGRRAPRRPYATRSRTGTPYIVRRRTTQQFAPYAGTRGYFVFPTLRQDMKGIRRRMLNAVAKAVSDG